MTVVKDYPKHWKYPYFSEFEFEVLCPDIPYLEPGDELYEGIFIDDFEVFGLQPKIFRFEGPEILQLLPVIITKDDGTEESDVWTATIARLDGEAIVEDEIEDEPDED